MSNDYELMLKESEQYAQAYEYKHRVTYGGSDVLTESTKYWSWVDSRTGYRNPWWRKQVMGGRQAGTTLNANQSIITMKPFAIQEDHYVKPGYGEAPFMVDYISNQGMLIPSKIPDLGDVSVLSEVEANNQALESYVRNIRKLQTSFQGGTFVAELGKAIHSIKKPFRRLQDSLRLYLNRMKARGVKASYLPFVEKRRIVAESWLEYQYHWRPTLHDVEDAAFTLYQTLAKHNLLRDWKRVKGSGKAEDVEYFTPSSQHTTHSPGFTAHWKTTSRVIVKYSGLHELKNYRADNQRVGFDVSNWVPTLWEIVPYSFLVDYFTNIGNVISAATLAKSGLRWTSKTVIREIESSTFFWEPDANQDGTVQYGVYSTAQPGVSSVVTRIVHRANYTGSLVPEVQFSLPFSGTKWLNMAALGVLARETAKKYR